MAGGSSGLTGWGWDDVLPFFKRHEDHFSRRRASITASAANGASRIRACAGTSSTRSARRPSRTASSRSTTSTAATMKARAYFQVNQKRGRRWSAARGFLKPVLGRPQPAARDRRAWSSASMFEGGARPACAGARTAQAQICARPRRGHPGGRRGRLAAVAAELSGIGPGARLQELGIPVRARPARASARTCRTICSCA